MLWIVGIGMMFAGDMFIKMLGFTQEPELYTKMKNNKMIVGGALFVLNNIGTNLMNTGAFEVYLNNELVYSKLQTGQPPSAEILFEILKDKGLSDGVVW